MMIMMIMKTLLPLILLLLAPSLPVAVSTNASHVGARPSQPLRADNVDPEAAGTAALPANSSGANSKDRANDAELSALRASLQTKLDELHRSASFPGATIGFVLPDGRSGSVSAGLADVENKFALKPTDRMLAGSTATRCPTARSVSKAG